jgi:hypothetical protein
MTAHGYLELAERYQKALATVKNAFARQHLQAMVRSYRTLADSERQLRKSASRGDAFYPHQTPPMRRTGYDLTCQEPI